MFWMEPPESMCCTWCLDLAPRVLSKWKWPGSVRLVTASGHREPVPAPKLLPLCVTASRTPAAAKSQEHKLPRGRLHLWLVWVPV